MLLYNPFVSAFYVAALEQRQAMIAALMKPFNDEWRQLMIHIATGTINAADGSQNSIFQPAIARKLTEILRVNERVAR